MSPPANSRDWSDVSLDEINCIGSEISNTKMEESQGNLASMSSTEAVYPQAPKSLGLWARRSGLEKALLGVLGVCGLAMVAGGCVIALQSNGSIQDFSGDSRLSSSSKQLPDMCITPECVVAAGDIIESMDTTADPCEDFFRFSCGGWIDNNVIPDSSSRWGKFYELRDKVDVAVRAIVESPIGAGDPVAVQNLKNYYAGCMNTESIETEGYASILSLVFNDGFGGWPMIQDAWDGTTFSWESAAASSQRYQIAGSVMITYPYLDSFDTSHNILYIDQPSFGLPRDMFEDPVGYAEYVEAYITFMVEVAAVMAREAGQTVTQESLRTAADALFELERQLAMRSVPSEDRRNTTEMYNPYLISELKAEYLLDWDSYFTKYLEATGVTVDDAETVILVEPEYLVWVPSTLEAQPDAVVADYLYWRRIMAVVGEGPQEFRDILFRFNQVMTGQSEAAPRWSSCISKASSEDRGFAYAVGAEYISAHFDDLTKAEAAALVEDLRVAFKQLVDVSSWMDPATQVLAKEKADLIVSLVGFPDWLQDDAELDLYYAGVRPPTAAGGHFDNVQGIMTFAASKGINSLRKTPNREDWITQPAIVNAFYSPVHNSISFPAGILQPPFFGKGYPRYLNYGAIGVVMGHEITHGFDDQGRQYDGVGNAAPWWPEETIAAFTEKAQCYIDQYDGYVIEELIPQLGEDAHVNGVNTQGENIADNGGVHEAYTAYLNSVAAIGPEGTLPGLTQFTPEQLFFIAYAQVWCEKTTLGGLLNQILTDPHSPGQYRVWGPLSNSPDFVTAFACPAGSNMNRPEKCDLW